jgi:hypothetical protein
MTEKVFLHDWHEIIDVDFVIELNADFVDFRRGRNRSHIDAGTAGKN